jgi:hypothetical protein
MVKLNFGQQDQGPLADRETQSGFSLKDTVMGVARGGEGVLQGAYSLVDTLSADLLPDWDDGMVFGHAETTAGAVVEGIVQFAAGFALTGGAGAAIAGASKLGAVAKGAQALSAAAKTSKAVSLGVNAAKGAITDFTFFEGQGGRMSDMLQGTFLENDLTRYLATGAEDTEIEGRLKNALEGLGLGAIVDGVVLGWRKLGAVQAERMRAKAAGKEPTAKALQAAADSVEGDVYDELRKNVPEPAVEIPNVTNTLDEFDKILGIEDIDTAGDLIPEFVREPIKAMGVRSGKDLASLIERWRAREADAFTYAGKRVEEYGSARDLPEGGAPRSSRAEISDAGADPDDFLAEGGLNLLRMDIGESQAAMVRALEWLNAADFAKRSVSEAEAAAGAARQLADLVDDATTATKGERDTFEERVIAEMGRSSGDPILDAARRALSADDYAAQRKALLARVAPDVVNEMAAALSKVDLNALDDATLVDLGKMYERGVEYFRILNGLKSSTGRQLQAYSHDISRTLSMPEKLQPKGARAAKEAATNEAAQLSLEIKRLSGSGRDGAARQRIITELQKLDALLKEAGDSLPDKIRAFDSLGKSNSMKGKPLGMLMEYFMGNLLSGIKTHMVNVAGNTTAAAFRPIESIAAGTLQTAGMFIGKSNWAQASSSFMRAADEIQAIGEMAVEMAVLRSKSPVVNSMKRVLKGADSVLLGHGEGHELAKVTQNKKHLTGESLSRTALGHAARHTLGPEGDALVRGVGTAAGAVARAPMRLLQTSDEFFKHLNFRMTLKSDLKAQGRAAGKTGQALADYVAEQTRLAYRSGQATTRKLLWNNAIEDATRAIGLEDSLDPKKLRAAAEELLDENLEFYENTLEVTDRAVRKAKEYTFTDDVDGEGIFDSSIRAIGGLRAAHPGLSVFFPFTQTPGNLAKFSARRSFLDPTAAAIKYFANSWSGKGFDNLAESTNQSLRLLASGSDAEKADVLGRWGVAMGSSVALLTLATRGVENLDAKPGEEPHWLTIMGRGPLDPLEKKAWLAAGNMEYSLRFGNTNISLERLDPYASVLGLMADIAQYQYFTDKPGETEPYVTAIVASIAQNFTNKTYLTGMDNLMTVIKSQDIDKIQDVVQGIVGGFAPGGAFVAQANQSLYDGHLKEIRSSLDAVMSRYPMWSDRVENRRNFLGEEMMRIGWDEGGTWESRWSPFPRTDRELADPLMKEMAATRYAYRAMATKKQYRGISVDLYDYTAPNGRTAVDRVRELSSTIEIGGKTMRERLMETINDEAYKALPYAGQEDIADNVRASILGGIMRGYRQAAFHKLLEEIPEIDQDVNARLGQDPQSRASGLFEQ